MAWSGAAVAQAIPIGRSSLTLPEPQRWSASSLPANDPAYSGDKSGVIPMDHKRLVFVSPQGATKAVVLARVTKGGVSGVRMSWGNSCVNIAAGPYVYKRDRSNTTDVDCLIVLAVGQPAAFLDSVPALKKDLDGNIPKGDGFYYIQYTTSIGEGGVMLAQVLVSPDFSGLAGVSVEHLTRLPVPVLAWAGEFAKGSRPAIASLSGNWTIPPLAFSQP